MKALIFLLIITITNYSSTKQKVENERAALKTKYTNSSNKTQTLEEARKQLTEYLYQDIFNHWYTTKWSFEGHTETPKQGTVACGYFVSTTLRDVGFNLNRYKLAQKNPENEAKVIACGTSIEKLQNVSKQELKKYFLKQKNGVKEFAQQRQKLIDIYSNINSLFGHFEYGGTYFGHQSSRILGYAEYSIYLLPKNNDNISKTYDITKQKELYIKSLRQLIEDENKIDFNTLGQEKIERTKKLNKIVDELDKLITDNFYLRRAQEFQYGHYEYY